MGTHIAYLKTIFSGLVFLLAIIMSGTVMADTLTVKDMRIGQHPDKVRIALDMNAETPFRVFVLKNPYRVVLDLPEFNWQASNKISSRQKLVSAFRHGTLKPGLSRVVFETTAPPIVETAFNLPRAKNLPDRLVIDIKAGSEREFEQKQYVAFGQNDLGNVAAFIPPPAKPAPQETTQTVTKAVYTPPPPAVAAKKSAPSGKKVIVIDPGHGGNDPGAISISGTYEKNIVLSLSRLLRSELEATGHFIVHMTRENDKYIRLRERVAIARAHKADLFMSIHADSMGNHNVRGASVYTLSETASDAEAAKLAEKENRSDIIAGVELAHEDQDIADILIDLAMRDTMNQSKRFAHKIAKNLKAHQIKTLKSPEKSAGFAVLKAPDIPSVLVEAGYLSNKTDANLLETTAHQKQIAAALTKAVLHYFEYE